MGTILLILLGILIIVGIIFYPRIYLIIFGYNEVIKLHKSCMSTKKFNDDVFILRDGFTNLFLVKYQDGYIAFDGGEKVEKTKTAFKELNIDPQEVKAVFLTHSDEDHCGAVELFTKADIYLAKAEECILDGSVTRTFTKHKVKIVNKLKVDYKTLEDGNVFQFGDKKVECFHTPGHTPGSMCFLVDDNYLFTGDLIKFKNGLVQPYSEIFTMDNNELKQNIRKLVAKTKDRNIQYVFSAHNGYTDDYNKAFQNW